MCHKQFPDLPTMAEQGFESSQVNSWYAFVVPKKTPRNVVERLSKEINAVLAGDEAIARIDKIGGTVIAGWSPQQTTKMIASEYARWAEVVRKAGLEAK